MLGPILFNDLVRLKLDSKIYLFADDMALSQGIRDISKRMLCYELQLNPKKCKIMYFNYKFAYDWSFTMRLHSHKYIIFEIDNNNKD